jgi:hypothetical protein
LAPLAPPAPFAACAPHDIAHAPITANTNAFTRTPLSFQPHLFDS